jgi:hypothetical protein
MKFLANLPKIFVTRYLNTHAEYLKSFADIITHLYVPHYDDWEEACSMMLARLPLNMSLPRREDVEFETLHFRNLRNCWYHECAMNYPFDDVDERLRFAAWKIIQCYYSVFSSIASLVCLEDSERKSIDTVLNKYMTDFICNSKRKYFFLPPVNVFLDQRGKFSSVFSEMIRWKYADERHLPTIKKCLKRTRREIAEESNSRTIHARIGVPHYLKTLRDWANYQDAYLFFRLYGPTVKSELDFSLKRITFIHCVQTEFFLMKTFGLDAVKLQFKTFQNELKSNIGIISPTLDSRFKAYLRIERL